MKGPGEYSRAHSFLFQFQKLSQLVLEHTIVLSQSDTRFFNKLTACLGHFW